MHQVRLTSRELLRVADIDIEALKSKRRRDQVAIAFGGDDIVAGNMYLPLDAVALMLSSALARSYGASLAVSLVRAAAAEVLIAVAQAGVSKQNVPLAVIDLVRGDGRRAFIVSTDAIDPPNAAQGYVLQRVVSVNITHIVGVVRERAMSIGLDLSAPFLPLPDTEAFDLMMMPFADALSTVIEEKALKKRDVAMRRIGAQARLIATGGRIASASHKQPPQARAA